MYSMMNNCRCNIYLLTYGNWFQHLELAWQPLVWRECHHSDVVCGARPEVSQ